jgi:prepilin-type N-terminal cleavage/methylation domain-containing protein
MTTSRPRLSRARSGFTLVELMIVIGIILILIGLLFPAISAVRRQAAASATKQEMSRIQIACNAYYQDFRAYPGPIPESMLATQSPPAVTLTSGGSTYPLTGISPSPAPTLVTSSENLYLGLCGSLSFPGVTGSPTFGYTQITGAPPGPANLGGSPGTHPTYINYSAFETTFTNSTDMSTGEASNGSNPNIFPIISATDSCIPEFVDHFSPARPILYLRARVGTTGMLNLIGQANAATVNMMRTNSSHTDGLRRSHFNPVQLQFRTRIRWE